jgi:hypothetical protein
MAENGLKWPLKWPKIKAQALYVGFKEVFIIISKLAGGWRP